MKTKCVVILIHKHIVSSNTDIRPTSSSSTLARSFSNNDLLRPRSSLRRERSNTHLINGFYQVIHEVHNVYQFHYYIYFRNWFQYDNMTQLPHISHVDWTQVDLTYLYPWNLLSLLLVTDKNFALTGPSSRTCGHFTFQGRWGIE